MKSRFWAVFALCLIVPFAIIFSACGEDNKTDADEVKLTSVQVAVADDSWCAGCFANNVFTIDDYDVGMSSFTKADFVVTAEYSDGHTMVLGGDNDYVFSVSAKPSGEITKDNKQYSVYSITFAYKGSREHSLTVYKLKYDPATASTLPLLSGITKQTGEDETEEYWIDGASDWVYDGTDKNAFDYVFVGNQTLTTMIANGQIDSGVDSAIQQNAGEYRAAIWPSIGYQWNEEFLTIPTDVIILRWNIGKKTLSTPVLQDTAIPYCERINEDNQIEAVQQTPDVAFGANEAQFFDVLEPQSDVGIYDATISIKYEYQNNYCLAATDNVEDSISTTLGPWEIIPSTVSAYLDVIGIDSFSISAVYQGKTFTPEQIAGVLDLNNIDPNWSNKIVISMANSSDSVDNTNISVANLRHGEIEFTGKISGNYSGSNAVITKEFTIMPLDITNNGQVVLSGDGVGTEFEYETEITLGEKGNIAPTLSIDFGEEESFIEGKFLSIAFDSDEENYLTAVGDKGATITLLDTVDNEYCNYTGTRHFNFSIVKKKLVIDDDAPYGWSGTDLTYNGKNQKSSVSFNHGYPQYNGMINVDYAFSYNNQTTDSLTNAGTYVVTATLSLADYADSYYELQINPNCTTTTVEIVPVLVGQINNENNNSIIRVFIGSGREEQYEDEEPILVRDPNLTEVEYTGSVIDISVGISTTLGEESNYNLVPDSDFSLSYSSYDSQQGDWIPCIANDIVNVGRYRIEINYSNNFACYKPDEDDYVRTDVWAFDIIEATTVPDSIQITWPTVYRYLWSDVAILGNDGSATLNGDEVEVAFRFDANEDEQYYLDNNQATLVAEFVEFGNKVSEPIATQIINPFMSFTLNNENLSEEDLENLSTLNIGDEISFTFDTSIYAITNILRDSNNQAIENAVIDYLGGACSYIVGMAEDSNEVRYNEANFTLNVYANQINIISKDIEIDLLACFSAIECRTADDNVIVDFLSQGQLENTTSSVGEEQKLFIGLTNNYRLSYERISPSDVVTQELDRIEELELTNDGSIAQVVVYVYHASGMLVYTLHYNFEISND